jgi:hypothetical protein
MVCRQCNTNNADGNKFCGSCGAAMPETDPVVPVPGEAGAFNCGRHKNIVTRLRCGRCETPICPKCTVYTPAGTRCRNCSKNKIAIRPRGVINRAGQVLDDVASSSVGRRIWYVVIFEFILSLFRGFGE